MTTDPRGMEPKWPAYTAWVAVGVLSLAHPPSLTAGPRWLVIAIISAMMIPATIAHGQGNHRVASILLTAANLFATVMLVWSVGLLVGALPAHQVTPVMLLRSAAALWITNILVFALWYWRLDAGGPHLRAERGEHQAGAFLFPQMTNTPNDTIADQARGWKPLFADYLFLAFTTSTALSPADVPPLSRWAKLMMMIQALISLTIIVILVGRGVNVL